jgi:hypothetical protein
MDATPDVENIAQEGQDFDILLARRVGWSWTTVHGADKRRMRIRYHSARLELWSPTGQKLYEINDAFLRQSTSPTSLQSSYGIVYSCSLVRGLDSTT